MTGTKKPRRPQAQFRAEHNRLWRQIQGKLEQRRPLLPVPHGQGRVLCKVGVRRVLAPIRACSGLV